MIKKCLKVFPCNINFYYKQFCVKENKIINDENYAEGLSNLNSFTNYENFYLEHEDYIEKNIEKKLLYLENYSNFNYHNEFINDDRKFDNNFNFRKILLNKLQNNEILKSDLTSKPIYILSIIESLYKLDYYEDNKIWIILEHTILRTDFLKNITIDYFYIILKAFQKFFLISESTIHPEEIFENVEYNTIIHLKKNTTYQWSNININIIELYNMFSVNFEGSLELYHLFIDKILLPNMNLIFQNDLEMFIKIYFTTVMITLQNDKDKKINYFASVLEDKLNDKNSILCKKADQLDNFPLLKWAMSKRNKNYKLI
jgi:hypothetical protein